MSERRGLQGSINLPDAICAVLIRADVEKSAGALADALGTSAWRKNVSRKALPGCDLSEPRFYPFQYRGHSWTTVVHRFGFWADTVKRVSSKLRTSALWVSYEDTSNCFDYLLFDSGKLVEICHCDGGLDKFSQLRPEEFSQVEDFREFPSNPYSYFAGSRIRKLDAKNFAALTTTKGKKYAEHLSQLFDDFIRSQDAYVAFNFMDDPGREYFPLAEATDDEIVRIDIVGE